MTGPFRFRLAKVLAVWQQREDAALAVFHREIAKVEAAKARVAHLRLQLKSAREGAITALADPSPGTDPAWHRNWITQVTSQIDLAVQDLAARETEAAAAHARWQKARRDRRVIDRLRERAERRHAVEMRRAELLEMNERASLRARKDCA